MYQAGTLRKRRQRNLAKVNGLTWKEGGEALPGFQAIDNIDAEGKKIRRQHTTHRLSSDEISYDKRITRDADFHYVFEVKGTSENVINTGKLSNIEANDGEFQLRNSETHFLTETTMALLKLLVFTSTIFFTVPWKWNEEKYKVERRSSQFVKFWRWTLRIGSIQTVLLFCFQLHAVLQVFYAETTSNRQAFMASFALLWTGGVLAKNAHMYFYEDQTRKYINAMLRFNELHVKNYVISLDDYSHAVTLLINPIFFIQDLAQIPICATLFLKMPFMPWFLFSYVYPKPWYWLIPGAFHEMMTIGQAITFALLTYWTIVAHGNTLRFWLREIHNNNESDYTIDELRLEQNAMGIYKALEVLNGLYNECMAPVAIPSMKTIWALGIAPCGYILIRSMNHLFIDEFPGILSFPFAMVAMMLKAFAVLTVSAEVSDLGCGFLDSWSLTKDKNVRRILMGCPTLKIWNRKFYFITVSTTITYFKQVFSLITDCVITFP